MMVGGLTLESIQPSRPNQQMTCVLGTEGSPKSSQTSSVIMTSFLRPTYYLIMDCVLVFGLGGEWVLEDASVGRPTYLLFFALICCYYYGVGLCIDRRVCGRYTRHILFLALFFHHLCLYAELQSDESAFATEVL